MDGDFRIKIFCNCFIIFQIIYDCLVFLCKQEDKCFHIPLKILAVQIIPQDHLNLGDIGRVSTDCIHLALDRTSEGASVNMVTNFQVPKVSENS
jgi:hypothetical protein